MIVVTGATGELNGATVDHLLDRVPAADLAVVVRDEDRAARFAVRGVEVRRGDYADPGPLPEAFRGADQLLLVSSNTRGGDTVAQHRAAIEAAVEAKVGRILYTSHQGAGRGSPFPPADSHAATEELLAESGVPWTSLRNGFYAHSLTFMAGPWRATGMITVPVDGPVSWTARSDEAEAAAVILTGDRAFDGPVTLTADAAPTFRDVAAIASGLVDREIRCEVVGEDAWVTEQVRRGTPEAAAHFALGMYQAAAEGRFAGVDPTLGELLGRAPLTVRDVLAADLDT